ncbi:MAG: acyl-CoA-binding protein [Holophagae bacterium]|nr:MAG: acyl-CoA-binding protein [Holophagae bacterium]
MDLRSQFEDAAARSRTLGEQPNDVLLNLYALYKQATAGDASGPRPGGFNMVGRAKFDAWSKLAGTSAEQAMQDYIALVDELSRRA